MLEDLFMSSPLAWILGALIVMALIFLSLKYRFWLIVVKLCAAVLFIVILYSAIPFIQDLLYGEWLLSKLFYRVTPNFFDDWQFELNLLINIIAALITAAVLLAAVKSKKRADPNEVKRKDYYD